MFGGDEKDHDDREVGKRAEPPNAGQYVVAEQTTALDLCDKLAVLTDKTAFSLVRLVTYRKCSSPPVGYQHDATPKRLDGDLRICQWCSRLSLVQMKN